MNFNKLSKLLTYFGLGIVVVAFFWWFKTVLKYDEGYIKYFECFYLNSRDCWLIEKYSSYSQYLLYIGLSLFFIGNVLKFSLNNDNANANDPSEVEDEMKCPKCDETIKKEAKICKHCSSKISMSEHDVIPTAEDDVTSTTENVDKTDSINKTLGI